MIRAAMSVLAMAVILGLTGCAGWCGGQYPETFVLALDESSQVLEFEFTDADKWRFHPDGAMECEGMGAYAPPVRSPHIIALLSDRVFGDFVLDVELQQNGREYGHRDMCLFFGFQDPSHFYYAHLASQADPNAHNIFVVNGAPRQNIAEHTTEGIDWGEDAWRHIRLERSITDGTIRVFFEDMETPVMEATDTTFGPGYIGFGSFDDSGLVRNIRIRSSQIDHVPSNFYGRKITP